MAEDDILVISSDSEGEKEETVKTKKRELKELKGPTVKDKKTEEDKKSNGTNGKANATVASSSSSSSGSSLKEVECIDIDDDIDEMIQSQPSSIPKPLTEKEELQGVIDDLVYSLKKLIKPADRAKVKKKLDQKMQKINETSETSVKELTNFIVEKTQLLVSKPSTKWSTLDQILKFMNCPGKNPEKKKGKTETDEERRARKKASNILRLESHLKQLEDRIREWDDKEVNLDDDKNSAYLVRTRMINMYMKHYKNLCKEAGANYYTGRPIEKRIKIADGIACSEIKDAVEKYMNGKDILFIPDFHDIETIVLQANNTSKPPLIPETDIKTVATSLFHEVLRILRSRRQQDFSIVIPIETITDPAELDPELERKLTENKKQGASEQSVIEKFAKLQEEDDSQHPVEVEDENPDDSAGESDDETEDEDLAAEQEDGEIEEEETRIARDQASEEDDEMEDNEEESNNSVSSNHQNEEKILENGKEDSPSPSKRQRKE